MVPFIYVTNHLHKYQYLMEFLIYKSYMCIFSPSDTPRMFIKPEYECEGNTLGRQQFIFLIFLTYDCSLLNIHFIWGVSFVLGSFWYVHDSGTIKSCIRIGKNWVLGISKKWSHKCLSSEFFSIILLKAKKLIFFPILMQLLMVPWSWADQKLPKTIETPHLKWILR